jgi:hypothetical protein
VVFGLHPEASLLFEQIAAPQQQVTALSPQAKFQAGNCSSNVPTRQYSITLHTAQVIVVLNC